MSHVECTAAWLDDALAVARRAAGEAAKVIARHYRDEGLETMTKADDTPVTRADIESEQVIRQVLLAAFPDHAIHGEEGGRTGTGECLWLVDPIDGTKSFVRRYPMFSTQIALMVRGELVLGVSCAAEFGETMWARRGGGAWLDGKRVQVGTAAEWSAASVSTGNLKRLAQGAGWAALGELIPRLQRIRGYGDFYHYHLLARGAVDLVVESDLNILDIAALAVIVGEAGGVFTDLDGAPIGLDTSSALCGTPALHAKARDLFAGWLG